MVIDISTITHIKLKELNSIYNATQKNTAIYIELSLLIFLSVKIKEILVDLEKGYIKPELPSFVFASLF